MNAQKNTHKRAHARTHAHTLKIHQICVEHSWKEIIEPKVVANKNQYRDFSKLI